MVSVKLKMEAKSEENQKSNKSVGRKKKNSRSAKAVSKTDFSGELNEPRWSVVSFESRIAGSLNYEDAARKLEELRAKKISGLCIITDEAAERIINKK